MHLCVDEYACLEPLSVRQRIHREFSDPPDQIEAVTMRAAELGAPDSVLDVGPGTGSFLRALAAAGHRGRLAAADLSRAAAIAAGGVPGTLSVQGDACALPFANMAFDVVFARHMLYHVSDLELALRELRRVLTADGKFVAVVNHPGQAPRLHKLLRRTVELAGITPPTLPTVDSSTLPPLLRTTFGNVDVHRFDSHLVFHEPRPLITLAVALLTFYGVPADSPHRPAVIEDITTEIDTWFTHSNPPWRDPKGYAVCVSRRG